MVESSKDDAASVSNTKNDPATWEINEIVLVAFATALIFSLSEHIVFAIQASIPVALLLISVVFALFVGRVMGELITSEPGKAIGKPYRITLTTKGWHWSRVVLLVVLGVFVVVAIRQAREAQIYALIPGVLLIVIIILSSNYRAPLVMVMSISTTQLSKATSYFQVSEVCCFTTQRRSNTDWFSGTV